MRLAHGQQIEEIRRPDRGVVEVRERPGVEEDADPSCMNGGLVVDVDS